MKTLNIFFSAIIILTVLSCNKEELEFSSTKAQLQETNFKGKLQNILPNEVDCFFIQNEGIVSDNLGIDNKNIVSFQGQLWAVVIDASSALGHRAGISEMWSSNDGKRWILRKRNPFNGRENAYLVVHNNRLWMMGGVNGANQPMIDIWSSSNGIDWKLEALAPFILGKKHLSYDVGRVTTFKNKIFVFTKGYTGNETLVYSSVDGKHWNLETANLAVTTRGIFETVVHGNTIYAMFPVGIFASYNGRWWFKINHETLPHSSGQVFGTDPYGSLTKYKDFIWYIGGADNDALDLVSRIWYTSDMRTWKKFDPKGKKGTLIRDIEGPKIMKHAALPFNDELLILGGQIFPMHEVIDNHKVWTLYQDCIEESKPHL